MFKPKNKVEHVSGFGPSDLLEGENGYRRMRVALDDNLSDPFDQLLTAEYTPILESKPLPTVSDLRDRVVTTTGSVTVAGGELVINGSTAKTSLYTRSRGRYLPGLYGLAGIGVRADFSTGSYEYGYGDDNGNRLGIEWSGGVPYTFVESFGSRYYRKPRSEWLDPLDGTGPSKRTLDPNKHTLRILIGWYGNLPVNFYIVVTDREQGEKRVLIDRAEVPSGSVTFEQPDLPIFAETNGGTLYVGGRQYGVYGRYRPQFRITCALSDKTGIGATNFEPIVSLKAKTADQWQGVRSLIAGFTAKATADSKVVLIVGGTLTGASWGAIDGIDANETSLEVDTTATAVSGGYRAYADDLTANTGNKFGGSDVELPDIDVAGDQLVTMAIKSDSGTADVKTVLRVREEF